MNKLRITEGKWILNKYYSTTIESNGRSIATTGGYSDNNNYEKVDIENQANAKLIADTGTTSNKCNKLPSTLLAENEEMKAMLKRIIDLFQKIY